MQDRPVADDDVEAIEQVSKDLHPLAPGSRSVDLFDKTLFPLIGHSFPLLQYHSPIVTGSFTECPDL